MHCSKCRVAVGNQTDKTILWADTVRGAYRKRLRDRKSEGETEIHRDIERLETHRDRDMQRVRDRGT